MLRCGNPFAESSAMPSPSPEVVVENLRRTLHAGIPHYAALSAETLRADLEDEMIELGHLLGIEWPEPASEDERREHRKRLQALLDTLVEAAREDQRARYERRETMTARGDAGEAASPTTAAVDRWLERWLSGKEGKRLP
jgi:hypothetical protein